MNIFVVHRNPVIAARMLCDAHIDKMITQSASLLELACANNGIETKDLQKRKGIYAKHPCVVWCSANRDNYEWLCWHALALCIEYEEREHKVHTRIDEIKQACSVIDQIPIGEQTPFARVINNRIYPQLNDLTEWSNTVLAYRVWYMLDKKTFAKWSKGRKPPAWWNPDFTLEVIQ